MIHVYAVTDASEPPPVRGIGGAPLELIACARLHAICSRHDAPPTPTDEAVVEHAAVVEAAAAAGAVVPVRFGGAFASERSLRDALASRAPTLSDALPRLRGLVELTVYVAAPTASRSVAASTGRDYLLARLRRREHEGAVAAAVHEPLADLAIDAVVRGPVTDTVVAAGCYLVERTRVADFVGTVERLRARHPGLDIVCTGPWPPYTFAEVDAA